MALVENGLFGDERPADTIRERIKCYLANWPVFVVCLALCISPAIYYIRYTTPKYIASTSFMIKTADGGLANSNDLIEQALNGKQQINLNNEILTISSPSLMQRTVAKNNFNVSYYKKGRILNIDIYKEAPFKLIPTQITDSTRPYLIYIKDMGMTGGIFRFGSEKEEKAYSFKWFVPFTIGGQTFVLAPILPVESHEGEYLVRWQSVRASASELLSQLTVKPIDTKTSVLELLIKTENLQLGKDVLNALFTEFNLSNIEDREKVYQSTVQFVEDRLLNISGELKVEEANLESYQGSNQLIDIKGQSSQYLANSDAVSKTLKDLSIQQGVVAMIQNYFKNPSNNNKLVPSSLGLNDATLASLITQYNELQLKKEREAPVVAENSTVMEGLNMQISNLKSSITESLRNINANLKLQENNFRQQNSQYRSLLASMPHNERLLQEIKRKQSITEGLYLYLLQKREEIALSSSTAFNVSPYKQIDVANGYGPVEPNTRNIILYSTLLGLSLAFGWIYLRDLLNDKIVSRSDIPEHESLPVIGEISHIAKKQKQPLSVLERNVTGEQFRAIRTNLSFLLKSKNKKVVLVTSCGNNEGKSLVSLNLAAVCALPGKKVALLEFDIKKSKPENSRINHAPGLTDYLSGRTNSLIEISQSMQGIPSLHIYPFGSALAYPTDLLMSDNISRLFDSLKEEYDYIIIDSPPVEVVSDAFLIGEFCEIALFVIRRGISLKKQLGYIKEINNSKKFKRTALILNDVKTSKKFGFADFRYKQNGTITNKDQFKVYS